MSCGVTQGCCCEQLGGWLCLLPKMEITEWNRMEGGGGVNSI